MWRAVLAGASLIVASVGGIVTALVTAHPSRGLWVALGLLVVVGAVLQAALTYDERRRHNQVKASGAGAVAVGGSARGEIRTKVTGHHIRPEVPAEQDGVTASGSGAVGIGSDAAAPISTEVTGDQTRRHDGQG
jgi:hypothetical protein